MCCLQQVSLPHSAHGALSQHPFACIPPLASFPQDLQAFAQSLAQPPVLYAFGRAWQRAAQPLMATSFYQAALASGLTSQDEHLTVGTLLLERGAKLSDRDRRGKDVHQAATGRWIKALLQELSAG